MFKRVLYYTFFRDNQGTGRDYVVITYTNMSTKVIYRGQPGFQSAMGKANAGRSGLRDAEGKVK